MNLAEEARAFAGCVGGKKVVDVKTGKPVIDPVTKKPICPPIDIKPTGENMSLDGEKLQTKGDKVPSSFWKTPKAKGSKNSAPAKNVAKPIAKEV